MRDEKRTAENLDVLVVGAGMAGQTVARKCASEGWDVAITDELPYGGTCALRGCDPKKVLVAAAAWGWQRRMDGRGVSCGRPRIEWYDLQAFKRSFTEPVPETTEESALLTLKLTSGSMLSSGRPGDVSGPEWRMNRMKRNPLHWLSSGGSALAAVVPSCPLCAAASGGLLSSLGVGAIAATGVAEWLVPLFLGVGIASLGVAARRHRVWWIPLLGLGGAILLYGAWLVQRPVPLWAGVGLVVVASAANVWRQRRREPELVQIGRQRQGEAR